MLRKVFNSMLAIGLMITLTACGAPAATTAPTTAATTEPARLTGEIKVYSRDATSGTREAFESIVGFDQMLTQDAFEVASNGDMATKVGADTAAIGYVSLTTNFAANNLHPVSYEGVEPTMDNVLDGTYLLKRPFSYVTRAAGDFESQAKEDLVAAFIDYMVNSIEGREIIFAAGGIVDVDAGTPWDELKVNHPIVNQDNSSMTLYTGGSTSVQRTLQAAIESFVPLAGNFQINMSHTGSSDGFRRVLGGEKDGANRADIGFASRAFNDSEDVSPAMESGIYCFDAVVVVTNIANSSVTNLSKDQIAAIFKGEITRWEDLN